ncbi:transposase [Cytophagaceae bacterium ABcell3]|nr:transposase [Cytophagaceae bacterium ABcell3]WMJ74872.1 transposase [Cytophagaceae bacterium ABcell3]WMJ75307.1 transposase [Cytophagaceae bacterium ABcell3]WMJ75344.1 transposase [Cytophagaceae bacterium ABcell3]WMJ75493.1 transposase [Cytophagaceae bacterium ABcell3]
MQISIFQDPYQYSYKWHIFKGTDLGKIYDTIPWDDLEECLPTQNSPVGAPRWFSNKGMFALMFLKAYLNLSDEKLIERFNTDFSLQFFCGKNLNNEIVKDKTIVSRIRTYIADHADMDKVQGALVNAWKKDMGNTHVLLMDATCYESYVRFPTDVKLLWECCKFVFEKQLYKYCKVLKIARPRSKYFVQKKLQLGYDRIRRKTYNKGLKRRKSLVYLLEKGLKQLDELLETYPSITLNPLQANYLSTSKKILEQQTFLLSNPAKELKNRIVSLSKPYLRPIIRGKETKPVEFGAKVHMMQVDGINIIDHISFDAFNEGTRLKTCVTKHKGIFKECHQLGADKIYATNANRNFLTENKIFTCFPKKGPKKHGKAESVLQSAIGAKRATVMEGSFGVEKEHYGLRKIKARQEKTERVWIFFGIMTANAARIAKRKSVQDSPHLQQVA